MLSLGTNMSEIKWGDAWSAKWAAAAVPANDTEFGTREAAVVEGARGVRAGFQRTRRYRGRYGVLVVC